MFYENKEHSYFSNPRVELLNLIPEDKREQSLLEIGAGTGDTLIYAKQNNFAKVVHGIDIMSLENSNQNSVEIDKFLVEDVENMDFSRLGKYDVILLGDVLEHLIEPEKLVEKLKNILNKDGVMIASIPNIREYNALIKIFFKGDFAYTDKGIFDRTHLRFFCKKNIIELFHDNEMDIINLVSNFYWGNRKRKYINKVTFGLLEEFLTVQYYVVVKTKE